MEVSEIVSMMLTIGGIVIGVLNAWILVLYSGLKAENRELKADVGRLAETMISSISKLDDRIYQAAINSKGNSDV